MKNILKILLIICLVAPVLTGADNQKEAEIQIKLGIKAAQSNQWAEAFYRWLKAVELDPNNYAAHNNLAVAFEQFGFFENALEEYEIAFKLAPDNLSIKSNIASFKEINKVK
jgi:Flp pilus assembly protein TadD